MLQISKLSVRYFVNDVPVQAVCSASLALSPGEAVGLLGESGCGKSTLARTILGLLPSTAEVKGSIRFEDVDITSATEADFRSVRGRKIALISQDPARTLNPVLTIGAQVSDVLRSHVSLSSSQGKARVMETLRSVGFDDPEQISRRYAHQLSGGERQRAAIAQAIVCRPALLIADEATSKLDARLKLELLRLFGSLRERYRMALLFITHEPAMAAAAAERLVVMYSGEIVEDGSAAAVLRNPLHPYTQALLQLARERVWTSGTPRARFSAIPGEPVSLHQGNCCYFQERCGQRLAGCTTRHPLPCHHDGREVLCMIYE